MRSQLLAAGPLALVLVACDSPASSTTGSPAGSALPSTSTATTPTATNSVASAQPTGGVAVEVAVPGDLDLAPLTKALKCAADAKTGACGILTKWKTCQAWTGVAPSGDGRWFGRGTLVEGGKSTDQVTLLRSRSVPASEVGPGQVPAKLALGEIRKDDGAAFEQVEKGLRALERGDVPQRASPTIEFIRKKTDWSEAFASKTMSGQVYVIREGGTFLCQGAKQTILLVSRAALRNAQGDGLYAELWPATW